MLCQFVRRGGTPIDRMSKPPRVQIGACCRASGAAAARRLLSADSVAAPRRIGVRPRSPGARRVCLAALAAAVLLPAAAVAQTIAVTTDQTGTNPVNIGKDDCDSNRAFVFRWDLGVTPLTSDVVHIFITKDTASCTNTGSEPTTAPTPALIQPTTIQQTGQATATAKQLLLDLPNGCSNTEHKATSPNTVFFCVRRSSTGTLSAGTLQVNFALLPPSPPSAPVATAGDSHLRLAWQSNDSGDSTYDVYVVPEQTTVDLNRMAVHSVAGTNVDVDHDSFGSSLVNDKTYDLYVRSIDAFSNKSALSAPASKGTPVAVDDFYSHYRHDGGSATGGGGCSSGGSAGLLAVVVFAAALRRHRRRPVIAAALVALAPMGARAADWTGLDRTPRRWLVGFKIDRYDPQVDSEPSLNGATPYHDIFHGRAPPRFQLEVDYQPFHPFGAVLLGGTIGLWQNRGKGLLVSNGQPSNDTAELRVVPFGAIATYRFDWLADRYRWLPIVPYVQAGLTAALWASFNGTGSVSRPDVGGRGSGWSYGYTTALGVGVDLGAVDGDLAREAYIDLGIQRTSLFAEYGWTRLNDFGKSGALILSDRAWRFGVSVEF
jgi:uncharacterized protein (TIGR03382 family)